MLKWIIRETEETNYWESFRTGQIDPGWTEASITYTGPLCLLHYHLTLSWNMLG